MTEVIDEVRIKPFFFYFIQESFFFSSNPFLERETYAFIHY